MPGSRKNILVNENEDIYATKRQKFITLNPNFKCNPLRINVLRQGEATVQGMVLYCMYRDLRVQDNWAMIYSQEIAKKFKMQLGVFTSIDVSCVRYHFRQIPFICDTLREIKHQLIKLNIPFYVDIGNYADNFIKHCNECENEPHKISIIVIDSMPTTEYEQMLQRLLDRIDTRVAVYQVDAHNVIPYWFASNKMEYNARTYRAKVKNLLPTFLTEFPPVVTHSNNNIDHYETNAVEDQCIYLETEYGAQIKKYEVKRESIKGGYNNALNCFELFLKKKLKTYEQDRNDPCSLNDYELSPWINFGNIAIQRLVLQVLSYRDELPAVVGAFMEDTMTRRELADNLFNYSDNSIDTYYWGPKWALKSLENHRHDRRNHTYSMEQLEECATNDPLWNAVTKKLIETGKINRFIRYYWAKKPIEWTKTPAEAHDVVMQLSKKYYLGGFDPEHIVGCLYSLIAIHDRPWKERPIYGKIRYMSYEGYCKKFDVTKFINYCNNSEE